MLDALVQRDSALFITANVVGMLACIVAIIASAYLRNSDEYFQGEGIAIVGHTGPRQRG